jgi:hypothetical protein
MKYSLKEMYRNGPEFSLLCEKFPNLNTEKIKVGVFIGTQICQLAKEPQFGVTISHDGKAAWNTFRHVATDFLQNVKAANFKNLWRILKFLTTSSEDRLQHVTQDAFPTLMFGIPCG